MEQQREQGKGCSEKETPMHQPTLCQGALVPTLPHSNISTRYSKWPCPAIPSMAQLSPESSGGPAGISGTHSLVWAEGGLGGWLGAAMAAKCCCAGGLGAACSPQLVTSGGHAAGQRDGSDVHPRARRMARCTAVHSSALVLRHHLV